MKEPDASTVITVDVYHNFDEADGNQRRTFNLTLTPDATAMAWGTGVWGTGLWGAGAASAVVVTGSNLGLARCVQLQFSGELGKNGVSIVLVTNFNHEGLKVNGYTYYSL